MALFFVDVALGQLLGVSGFGVYSNALAIIIILMVISLLGLENMLIREVATSLEAKTMSHTRQIIQLSDFL